jgi:hypothetical protein
MKRYVQLAFVLLMASLVCPAQQMVDRIVATVNRQPILLSDWEVEMRYEAMLEQKSLPVSEDSAHGALNRLIDQELLRQQMKSYRLAEPSKDEMDARIREIRKQIPGAESESGLRTILGRYGLSEGEMSERVGTQAAILRFIDVRLRPSVHVDRRSIESYYNDKLLPELRQKGRAATPLAEVAPQIEELLSQERVDALTNDWLKDLRQQSEIHVEPAASTPPNPTAKQEQGKR